ncbi:ANTAR domain-containing response regulator [Ferdinandcohnia quinoae]|uniref:Response regulator n=1 Tax=Fredinandcohnia quinoae TaxID=2918902 RepID=A0AAW5DTP1_9BACI|nr:response regulator [Fredinandcohnia sp. SECRCQ15]MCH1624015.1 response regulator [Fredinandcohnia sp. SECRCQ15]
MKHKLMIVDDDPITRMDLREMLLAEGYLVVAECKNGEEAIEQSMKHIPDLIIMDVKMPKLNGIKASKIIRSKLNVAILLLTAYSQRELIEDAKKSGVTAYLVKPVTEEDLIPAIEIALSQRDQIEWITRDLKSLKQKMEERRIIEKAKGKVMEYTSMTEEEAYQWMRNYCMKNRMSMFNVSTFILKELTEDMVIQ